MNEMIYIKYRTLTCTPRRTARGRIYIENERVFMNYMTKLNVFRCGTVSSIQFLLRYFVYCERGRIGDNVIGT